MQGTVFVESSTGFNFCPSFESCHATPLTPREACFTTPGVCSPCVSFALLRCFRHSVAPNVRMLCQRCSVHNLNQRPCKNRDANQHGRHTSICATRPVLNAFMVVYLLQRLLQRPVSHHVGAPGSSGTEQLESRQSKHTRRKRRRTNTSTPSSFFGWHAVFRWSCMQCG